MDMALSLISHGGCPARELRSMLRILQKQASCHDPMVVSALESS
jgi:hypothetical protein